MHIFVTGAGIDVEGGIKGAAVQQNRAAPTLDVKSTSVFDPSVGPISDATGSGMDFKSLDGYMRLYLQATTTLIIVLQSLCVTWRLSSALLLR